MFTTHQSTTLDTQKIDKEVDKKRQGESLSSPKFLLLQTFAYRHQLGSQPPKMQKAHSFEQHISFVKNLMGREEYKDRSNKEIDNILIQRINKYYVTTDSIQVDVQHFRPRLEPLYTKGVEPSNDTLVLFGIDFMKKQQLKEYFNISNSSFAIIDESNCIITFPSAFAAIQAIRTNADQQSLTHVKLQEDQESELSQKEENRRKWIQLKPYTFIYKRSRYMAKEYKRKLYVRYATTREKQAGFDKLSLIESMIARCKLIWEKQASNENTKVFLERKLISLNETKRTMQNEQQASNSQRGQQGARSRSREKRQNSSRMEVQKPERNQSNRQDELLHGVDDDLGSEIRSRASNSDMSQLINQMQNLQVEIDEHEKSIIANISMFKTKDKTQPSIDPDITYKLIQPAQLRVDYKNERFSYKAYVKESMQREENKKVVSFFDLTLE